VGTEETLAYRVQGAGADITVHDTERCQRQRKHTAAWNVSLRTLVRQLRALCEGPMGAALTRRENLRTTYDFLGRRPYGFFTPGCRTLDRWA
jgi:hypothetical protein